MKERPVGARLEAARQQPRPFRALLLCALFLAAPALAQQPEERILAVEARVLDVVFDRNQERRLFHRAALEVLSAEAGAVEAGARLSLELVHPLDVPPDQADRLRLLCAGDRGRFRLKETAEPGKYVFADASDPKSCVLLERGGGVFPPPHPMLLRPDERAADIAARGRFFLGLDLALGALSFIVAMSAAVMMSRRAPQSSSSSSEA